MTRINTDKKKSNHRVTEITEEENTEERPTSSLPLPWLLSVSSVTRWFVSFRRSRWRLSPVDAAGRHGRANQEGHVWPLVEQDHIGRTAGTERDPGQIKQVARLSGGEVDHVGQRQH